MNESPVCPSCGKQISGDAPGGVCPSCLIAMGMPKPAPSHNETTSLEGQFYAPRPEELAQDFPQLEIIELLGHGGMGAVYRARQINLDRIVALKVLTPRLSGDPSFAERFTREARTMAKLNHPNIVTVFDFGQAGPYYFLVMELIEGVNLREAIAAQTLSPEQALVIIPKVCEALQYAHDQGVIHRDIKPENILVGSHDQIKIADLGLAKLLDPKSKEFTLTATQQVLGTRNYMAPEQIEKPTTVDHRADIYSLGVVFYELLTGELPLGRFSLPSEKAPVSDQLDEVVLRTLEKEPARRFQQASQVKTAVESIEEPHAKPVESPIPEPDMQKPPVHPHKMAGQPSKISMPFKIADVHGGLSEAHGIAHFDGTLLEFEYRTHTLGIAKSNTQFVSIRADEILRATVSRGIFNDSIEFQSDRLETFDAVPTSVQGKIKLTIEKKNTLFAEEIARKINDIVKPPIPVERTAKPGPQKPIHALAHVPFKIPDVHAGVSEAFGIAKVTSEFVLVEFEIRDAMGITKTPAKMVTIPVSEIVAVSYETGIFSDKIEIQVSALRYVTDIPSSKQGKFVLRTKKTHRNLAEAFVRHASSAGAAVAADGIPVGKSFDPADERTVSIQNRVNRPARGLFAVAIINVVIISISLSLTVLEQIPWLQFGETNVIESVTAALGEDGDNPASRIISALFNATANVTSRLSAVGISAAIAVLLIMASGRMRNLRSYHFVVAVAILAALPIHSAFLLGLPFGIWALVVLLDPNTKKEFEQQETNLADRQMRAAPGERTKEFVWVIRAGGLFMSLFLSCLIALFVMAIVVLNTKPDKTPNSQPAPVTKVDKADNKSTISAESDDSSDKNDERSATENSAEASAESGDQKHGEEKKPKDDQSIP